MRSPIPHPIIAQLKSFYRIGCCLGCRRPVTELRNVHIGEFSVCFVFPQLSSIIAESALHYKGLGAGPPTSRMQKVQRLHCLRLLKPAYCIHLFRPVSVLNISNSSYVISDISFPFFSKYSRIPLKLYLAAFSGIGSVRHPKSSRANIFSENLFIRIPRPAPSYTSYTAGTPPHPSPHKSTARTAPPDPHTRGSRSARRLPAD